MKYYKLTLYHLFITFITIAACKQPTHDITEHKKPDTREALVNVNKYLVKKDHATIENYANRNNLDMQVTESGLWYMIKNQGNGNLISPGDEIALKYTVTLLDGTVCYSSDKSGLKKFEVGKGGVEAGIEEGVLLLKEGDVAKFILPPHLAHGLLGDEDRIPARAIIMYDIEVVEVK